jgi:hypothetical protein
MNKIFKLNFHLGFFRLSLFISIIVFVWAAFFEASNFVALTFDFFDEDKLEIIEKYGQYREKIRENPTYFIEYYFGWIKNKGRLHQLGLDTKNKKPCGCSSSEIFNRVINRMSDAGYFEGIWEGWGLVGYLVDYSGGYLVNNKECGIKPRCTVFCIDKELGLKTFYPLKSNYSIIPRFEGIFLFSIVFGSILAILAFIFFGLIIPFVISFLIKLIFIIVKYLTWVKSGFLSARG